MKLTKCHRALKHYFLSSLIICVILIGFSIPARAYQITIWPTWQAVWNECSLVWEEGNGYSKQCWESDNLMNPYFEIGADPGDPTNLKTPFEVKITYVVDQETSLGDMYNFDNYPQYEVFYAAAPISGSSQIWYAPLGQITYIGWPIGGENKIDITTYPDISDPSKKFAYAYITAETHVSFLAEIVSIPEPVSEPATMLQLGLGLLGLLGFRGKIQE